MLRPVGPQSSAVYWRRRLVLLAALVVLIVITVLALRPGGATRPTGAPRPSTSSTLAADSSPTSAPSTSPSSPARSSGSSSATSSGAAGGHPAASPSTSAKASAHSSAPPAPCAATQLSVSGAVGQSSYVVGAQPTVMLQVINKGPAQCVQNLADSQIVLQIYNGESRVWGSHDCQVAPGTDNRTLAVNQAVRVSIVWSGLTSQPGCAGTRQRVGAGTYTLYPYLSGHVGSAAQFSIS